MGLDNLLQEVISEERSASRAENGSDRNEDNNSDSDDNDYDRKSDNAIDYSDITELADDMPVIVKIFVTVKIFKNCFLTASTSYW